MALSSVLELEQPLVWWFAAATFTGACMWAGTTLLSDTAGKPWGPRRVAHGLRATVQSVKGYFSEHNRLVQEARRISHMSDGRSRSSNRVHELRGRKFNTRLGIREISKWRILDEALRQMRIKYVGPATLFSILLCLVNFIEPIIIGRFWDAVESIKKAGEYSMAAKLLGWRACIVTARYLLNVVVGILFANARAEMTQRVRREMFGLLLSQDMEFYDGAKPSELLERLKRDPESMEDFVNHSLEKIFHALIDLLSGLYLVTNYSSYLWGGSIILKALPVSIITLRAGKLVSMYALVQRHSLTQADGVAAEALSNLSTVRTHAAEEAEQRRHDKKAKLYLSVLLHTLYTETFLRFLRGYIHQMMELGFVILGAYCMTTEGLTMGRFLAFKSCLDKFIRGFNTISDLYAQMTKLKRTSVAYFDILDGRPSIERLVNTPQGRTLPVDGMGLIRYEDVTFAYPSRPSVTVLHNVSFEVQPGRMLALCGQSGMGKSTIIKLIQRLYDPSEGRITIDGVDIRQLDVRWLRGKIGYVSQEPTLMDCSIAENIAYGLRLKVEGEKSRRRRRRGSMEREVTMDDVVRAAQMANCHEFVSQLPEGYNTSAGAGGVLLSGGQRQRIAIARALIRDPKILLLDEATNQLDNEAEGAIQVAIENLLVGRTVMVIAHRMTTIRRAHRIAVVHEGSIVQIGTHEELLREEGGKYARLVYEHFGGAPNPQLPM